MHRWETLGLFRVFEKTIVLLREWRPNRRSISKVINKVRVKGWEVSDCSIIIHIILLLSERCSGYP